MIGFMFQRISSATRLIGRAAPVALWLTACDRSEPSAETESSAEAPALPPEKEHLPVADHLLRAGETAPNFPAMFHTGQRAELDEFLKQPVVVVFGPEASSAPLISHLHGLRDFWLSINTRIGMLMVVTMGDNVALRALAANEELPFPLVADVDLKITRAFGVPIEQGRPSLVTFVVGPERTIHSVLTEHTAREHVGLLTRVLDEMASGKSPAAPGTTPTPLPPSAQSAPAASAARAPKPE